MFIRTNKTFIGRLACAPLLWSLPEDGTSLSKHVAVYVCCVYLWRSALWDNTVSVVSNLTRLLTFRGGTWFRSWMRQCTASRKDAGSILDGVIGIFHWHNSSGRTRALGVDSTSNKNEYQEYFLVGKGGRCLRLINLQPSCADCLQIWELQTPGTLRACPGL